MTTKTSKVVKDRLRGLAPSTVRRYLSAQGWQRLQDISPNASVWSSPQDTGDYQVIVPERADLRDYTLRLSQVISTLADAEDRSQRDIVTDMENIRSAMLRFEIENHYADFHQLPLSDAIDFMQSFKSLIYALLHDASPRSKRNTLGEFRLAPSETGSYIFVISSPRDMFAALTHNELSLSEQLLDSVKTAIEIAQSSERSQSTLNAAFFFALEALCKSLNGGRVIIKLNVYGEHRTIQSEVILESSLADSFRHLASIETDQGGLYLQATGIIVEYSRRLREHDEIIVELRNVVSYEAEEEPPTRIYLPLSLRTSETAEIAFNEEQEVSIEGIVARVGRRFRMSEVRQFHRLQ